MAWRIKDWLCGFRAEREDGEMVFIYKRPPWGSGMCGTRSFYELRSRGELVARLSCDKTWKPRLRAQWLGEPGRALNEMDLVEITAALEL